MRARATIRIRLITAAVLLLAVLLVTRLYFVQIAYGEIYEEQAQDQYVQPVQGLFDRGSIFFTTREGEEVSAATLKTGYTLAITPDSITTPDETYAAIAAVTPIDRDMFMLRVGKKGDPYEEVADKIPPEAAEEIQELDIDGVSLYRDRWRYYPGDDLAAQTVGFVAYDGDDLSGRYGLERYYDDILVRDSNRLFVNFFAEIFDNLETLVFDTEEDEELRRGDVVTSIEPTVARMLEEELEAAHQKYESKMTGGIIMDPKTGEIYAIGIYPDFDLNDFSGVDDPSRFNNPLVESVYELGSIMKPLTVAAGIDAGAVTPYSTYYDAGFIELSGYTISNFDGKGRGTVSMQEVLNQSLNTGVAYIVDTMGKDRFRDYFKRLEFGTETGIDLPSETHGLVANLDSPRELEYATASFGQGIAVTPIAMVRALATLGNGGVLVTPHVAKEIRYDNGRVHEVTFPEEGRVFSESTSEEITRMLVEVVDSALAGGGRKMDRYTIAAKTGTAQIALEDGRGYYDDRYLHSFFGYFPAYDPKFLIFLYTVEPKNVRYASETLTDPFMNLTQFLINYYDLPPDR